MPVGPPPAARYGMAFLTVGIAIILRLGLNLLWRDQLPYLVFFPAVLFAALYGGLGPALLALLCSALAVACFVLPPTPSFHVDKIEDVTGLLAFCLVGLLIAIVADGQRKARQDAERNAAEAMAASQALQESERRLSFALDAARMGTWEWDVPTNKLVWSPQLEPIHGLAPGTFDGTFEGFSKAIHPDDREASQAAIARALESGTEFTTEFRVIYPDGSIHWIAGEGSVVRDKQGKPLRMAGVGMDVTARKTLELELRARAEREAVLNRIGQAIRSSTNPDEVQRSAITALGEALKADRCFFAHYDPVMDTVTVGADWRRSDLPSLAGRYRLADFHLDLKALYPEKGPLVIADTEHSDLPLEAVEALAQYGTRALLSIGLFEGETLAASVNAVMVERPRAWTPDEVSLMQSVATQLRAAFEAAQIRDREHRIAERLQDALRPTPGAVPSLDLKVYYQAALDEASIGGDFFDVFPLDGDRYALVVADLSGKGLDAAAQVATVRHMLRTMLYTRPTVAEAVTELNALLAHHALLSGFATLFVGVWEERARRLVYVSCGQEPGLVCRAATGDVLQMPPTGPVLGAFAGAQYTETRVDLMPGDALALFTDGLTEARLSRKSLMGLDGVSAVLREQARRCTTASALVDGLIEDIQSRTRGGIRDDVCLLAALVRAEADAETSDAQ
jgi:PAS domain S-box-containing protein